MAYRYRSTPWQLDTRSYGRTDNGPWNLAGGSLVNQTSTVEADYPDWDWRARIAAGVSATTVMNAVKRGTSFEAPELDGFFRGGRSSVGFNPAGAELRTWSMSNGVPYNVHLWSMKGKVALANLQFHTDPTLLSRVENNAIMGFRRKLAAARAFLQGTVAVGELRETIRMLRSPMASLRRFFDGYHATLGSRLGNRRRPLGELNDTIRDTWLEYSFGIRPLVDDLQGIAAYVVEGALERPPRKRTSFLAWDVSEANGNDNVTTTYGTILVRRRRERRRHYVGVRYSGMVNLDRATAFSRLGLTSDNPIGLFVPTIYELIPLSWLVDYGTNLGAIIEALSNGLGDVLWMERKVLTYQDSRWSDVTIEDYGAGAYWQWGYRSVGDLGTRYTQTFSRSPYVGSLLPSFQWRIPSRIPQWLNVAAIVHMFTSQSATIQRRNLRI